MRRPPEVGLVLLSLLASLPAVTGCAGVTQRLSLSSPVLSGSDGTEAARPAEQHGGADQPPARAPSPCPASRQPGSSPCRPAWSARRMCGRSRNRSGWRAVSRCSAGPGIETPLETSARASTRAFARKQARSRLDRLRPATHPARADEDIRPVQASSDDDSASNGATAGLGQRQRDGRPRLAEPPVAADRPHSLPESSGAVELDVSNAVAAGSEDHSSGETRPAPAAALQPEQGSPVASRSDSEIPGPVSAPDQAGTVSPAAARRPLAGAVRSFPTAGDGTLQWFFDVAGINPEPETPTAVARAANPSAETDSGAAQDPPAPAPPAQPTTPPAPPIPSDDRPAAAPDSAGGPCRLRAQRTRAPAIASYRARIAGAARCQPRTSSGASGDCWPGPARGDPPVDLRFTSASGSARAARTVSELAAPGSQGRAGPLIPAPARHVPYELQARFAMRAAGRDRAKQLSPLLVPPPSRRPKKPCILTTLFREIEGLVPWRGLRQVQEEPSSLVLS